MVEGTIYDGKDFISQNGMNKSYYRPRRCGDSFSADLSMVFLPKKHRAKALEFAVAASALKHTSMETINLVSGDEVEALAGGNANGRVQR